MHAPPDGRLTLPLPPSLHQDLLTPARRLGDQCPTLRSPLHVPVNHRGGSGPIVSRTVLLSLPVVVPGFLQVRRAEFFPLTFELHKLPARAGGHGAEELRSVARCAKHVLYAESMDSLAGQMRSLNTHHPGSKVCQ